MGDRKKSAKPKSPLLPGTPGAPSKRPLPADRKAIEHLLRSVMTNAGRERLSPREQAQDLYFQAIDAGDPETMSRLLQQCLTTDPKCIDANLLLVEMAADDAHGRLTVLRRINGWAKAELGAKFIRENTGHFWGLIETRPYMRARGALAAVLIELDRDDEAIREYEAMLVLNPNDNQGVRYPLLGLYLGMGRAADAQRLLSEYVDDGAAMFLWGRVLERFLAGDLPGAAQALWSARANNKHVEGYLAARKRLPIEIPDSYAFGSEDEAVICADEIGEAWRRNPAAMVWLREQG